MMMALDGHLVQQSIIFKIEVPNEHDIKLTSVKVPPYSATDVPQNISGVISNLGFLC